MKKNIKKIKSLFLITLLGIGISVIGCGKNAENESSSQEIAEQFLEQIFTSNYESRYTEFLEDENIETYYQAFSTCVSQECIEKLQKNRIPIKYDKEAYEKNISYVVSDIVLTFDETGTGNFEVVLIVDNNESSELKKATGQLKVENGKITEFFLSNIVPYKK